MGKNFPLLLMDLKMIFQVCLIFISLISVAKCVIHAPAQYYPEHGVVTVYVGNLKKTFNVEMITFQASVLTVFSEECVRDRCLSFRTIVNGLDDRTMSKFADMQFAPGLELWFYQRRSCPFQTGGYIFNGTLATLHKTPNSDPETQTLESLTFNNYDGYLPMFFRGDGPNFFEDAIVGVAEKMVTFVPTSPSSHHAGMYIGTVPENLCNFQSTTLVPIGPISTAAEIDRALVANVNVSYGKADSEFKEEKWNVLLRFGPFFSFSNMKSNLVFGGLASKHIVEEDFAKLPEVIIVSLPGDNEFKVPIKAMYDKRGDFYEPEYVLDESADFGLNQHIIRDKCIRLDKTKGDWFWGLADRND